MSLLYYHGIGLSKDYKQAMEWYLKSSSNGNIDSLFYIAFLYHNGLGITANIDTTFEYYIMAANQKHAVAQYILGSIYEYQLEVKDLQQSINWYQKAAVSGYDEAMKRVGILNQKGYYSKEDKKVVVVGTRFIVVINRINRITKRKSE